MRSMVLHIIVHVIVLLQFVVPCTGLTVCLEPVNTRSAVHLQYYLSSSPRYLSNRNTTRPSCWLPYDLTAPQVASLNYDDNNPSGSSKVGEFLNRIREWTEHHPVSLRLSPDVIARVKALRPKNGGLTKNAILQEQQTTPTTSHSFVSTLLHQQHKPKGPRWAVASEDTDLSGVWTPIATAQFKKEFDDYLVNCSQSYLFRKVVVNGVALQKESIHQYGQGRSLEIVATNPAGNWNRTLVASGAHKGHASFRPIHTPIRDPDGDTVQVEAWWEQQGKVHKSWLRGKARLQGGSLETARYLESENVLICESTFHPEASSSQKFKRAHIVWRYQRAVPRT